jgi:hypothetical protein
MSFAGVTAIPTINARSASDVSGYTTIVLTAGYTISFVGPLVRASWSIELDSSPRPSG